MLQLLPPEKFDDLLLAVKNIDKKGAYPFLELTSSSNCKLLLSAE